MAQLPLESPGGLSFTLGADTSGVKHTATAGVYAYDALNGTVNVARILDSRRDVTLTLGAEAAGDVIPVTVQVTDGHTPAVAVAAAVQVECQIFANLGSSNSPFFAASTTGTDNSEVGAGITKLLVTTDATGLALINVDAAATSNQLVRLVVRTLSGGGSSADLVYT